MMNRCIADAPAVTLTGSSWLGVRASQGKSRVELGLLLVLAIAVPAIVSPAAAQSLDYQTFKTRVEPIFLKQRDDHARCYACHSQSNNGFHLQRLASGASFWTEEQSQQNFAGIANVVNPSWQILADFVRGRTPASLVK
jgi:hypothetical protein